MKQFQKGSLEKEGLQGKGRKCRGGKLWRSPWTHFLTPELPVGEWAASPWDGSHRTFRRLWSKFLITEAGWTKIQLWESRVLCSNLHFLPSHSCHSQLHSSNAASEQEVMFALGALHHCPLGTFSLPLLPPHQAPGTNWSSATRYNWSGRPSNAPSTTPCKYLPIHLDLLYPDISMNLFRWWFQEKTKIASTFWVTQFGPATCHFGGAGVVGLCLRIFVQEGNTHTLTHTEIYLP